MKDNRLDDDEFNNAGNNLQELMTGKIVKLMTKVSYKSSAH